MGFQDRRYDERRTSGDGSFFRRILGEGENPLQWAFPLFSAFGIRVRIHVVFVLMILVDLIFSIPGDRIGWMYMVLGHATLILLVTLHEFGHCFACRWAGGEADEVLLWPLGGLATCRPPHTWKANLITTLGGPGVNLALAPILGGIVYLLGPGIDWVVFNPFSPGIVLGDPAMRLWIVPIFWLYYMNGILLAFNMLLPMYPMDAGRTVQGLLWARLGFTRSMRIAVNVGLAAAVVLFIYAMSAQGAGRLMALAIFGGFTCWSEKQRLRFMDEPQGGGRDFEFAASLAPDPTTRAHKPDPKAAAREQDHAKEVDRILAKIAMEGMGALTSKERRTLQKDTARRRRT